MAANVQVAKVRACLDVDIRRIVVPRQHKLSVSLCEKHYLVNYLVLHEDKLSSLKAPWLEVWTQPQNEVVLPVLKECQLLIPLLVNVQGHDDSQLVGKSLQEILLLMELFVVLYSYLLLYFDVETQR